MSFNDILLKTPLPNTRSTIRHDLEQLGLHAGMTLIVHSALSSLGYTLGGAVSVVQALMDVLTPEGTLVMPTHSPVYSDPEYWVNPPVDESWWPIIREETPAFETAITPSSLGRIPEAFRTFPGVRRSYHPMFSFAAWGKHADFITKNHSLDFGTGDNSPLGRLYDLDASVLLLGVDYDNNTSFHLAEFRVPQPKVKMQGSPILENGNRVWKYYKEIDEEGELFGEIGADFEKARPFKSGKVGAASCKLFSQRDCVDFALEWLTKRSQ